MTERQDRARGALLGLAVGDALGTTYEFARIDQAPYPTLATEPATDVVGDGPFRLAPGAITDDTQLAVCLASSLVEKHGFDAADVAARYVAWQDEAFDIGNQTRTALWHIEKTGSTAGGMLAWRASGLDAAGNGSLMRTTPIAVAFSSAGVLAALTADPTIAADLTIARSATKRETKRASEAASKSASEVASKVASKTASGAASKSASDVASKSASDAASKTASDAASKSASDVASKSASDAASKTASDAASKSASKSTAASRITAVIDASLADSMLTHADPRCMLACAAHNAAIAMIIDAASDPASDATDAAGDAPKAAGDATDAAGDAPKAASDAPKAASDATSASSNATSASSDAPTVASDATKAANDARKRGRAMLEAARAAVKEGARRLTALWTAGVSNAGAGEETLESIDVEVSDVDDAELGKVDDACADLMRDLEMALADDPDVYGEDVNLWERAGFVRLAFRLSFWHAVHTATWREALVDVASRGGDADTNGAIAGALMGARDGAGAIPAAWVERVLAARQPGSDEWAEAHHPKHLLALLAK